ncbi:MAG: ADP-ribosylglycohydrolase family protein [Oscillospiraceae bacterium]|nr:ADP-ribosylglycohydrolase family protein [Oscillospiraceae bacterium]
MFGALFGDVIGSYYEIHCTKDYDFSLNKESTFTDDSVLTAAVCKAILVNSNPIEKRQTEKRAREYAAWYKTFYSYFPNAGYGNLFSVWASDPRNMTKQRSYGNGAAMRAVPIGYAYDNIEQVLLQAKASCLYTHNSKEAIKGAQAVASAVFLANRKESKDSIKKFISQSFKYDLDYSIKDIRPFYSFDSSANYSVPPSIVAFLDSDDYESAVRNTVSLGGDADTMACIAGGIAEAFYGEMPEYIRKFCYGKLDHTIKSVAAEFCRKYHISLYRN